jgi:hypothetical protein
MSKIKLALAGILSLLAAATATAQQFPTVPDHSVIGRIGVVGQPGPSQAISFAALGANMAPAIAFQQNGAHASSATFDALYRGQIFNPVMWGVVCDPSGTAVGSLHDNTVALNHAFSDIGQAGGGNLLLGSCIYGFASGLNINYNNVNIVGNGIQATALVYTGTSSPAISLQHLGGGQTINSNGISNLTLSASDTANAKVMLQLLDVSSFYMNNVWIGHFPWDGTLLRGGGGSVGIQIAGRELGSINNMMIYAELPLLISPNADSATDSMDSWNFHNNTLNAGATTNAVITVQNSVCLYNTHFTGHQNWIGGQDGFHWVDTTSTCISEGLELSGIKREQETNTTGYMVNIQVNDALYGLKIRDSMGSTSNGIKLRKVSN